MMYNDNDPLDWLLNDPDIIRALDSFDGPMSDLEPVDGDSRWKVITSYGLFDYDLSISLDSRLTVLDHFDELHRAMEHALLYQFGLRCTHDIRWARKELLSRGVIDLVTSRDIEILYRVKNEVHHRKRAVSDKVVLRLVRALSPLPKVMTARGVDLSDPLIRIISAMLHSAVKVYGSEENDSLE